MKKGSKKGSKKEIKEGRKKGRKEGRKTWQIKRKKIHQLSDVLKS